MANDDCIEADDGEQPGPSWRPMPLRSKTSQTKAPKECGSGDSDKSSTTTRSPRHLAVTKIQASTASTKTPLRKSTRLMNKPVRPGVVTPDSPYSSETESVSLPEDMEFLHDKVKQALLYLLTTHAKSAAVNVTEIAKNACEMRKPYVEKTVMPIVKKEFLEVFGCKLIETSTQKGDANKGKRRIATATSYIIVSKFPASVTIEFNWRSSVEDQASKSFLIVALTIIFMQQKAISDSQLYAVFKSLLVDAKVCRNEEDFRKFLKREYVQKLYLSPVLDEANPTLVRYEWGIRAEAEISKLKILRFVHELMPEILYGELVQSGQAEDGDCSSEMAEKGGKLVARNGSESSDVQTDSSDTEEEHRDGDVEMEDGSDNDK